MLFVIPFKTATCLVDPGFSSITTVESKFAPAKNLWRAAYPGLPLPPKTLHSLPFWEAVLREERQAQGKPRLPGIEAATLYRHILTLDAYWTVDMRYQGIGATAEDASLVRDAVNWIHQNHAVLWR